MDELKKEQVFLQDGRRAEKVVQENQVDGETKTVTELWAEPKVDMRLTQRVSEFKKPVVCRRIIETLDESTGEVVDQKIESIEPEVKMQLREHFQAQDSIAALSVKDDDCECYVTREDIMEGFLTFAKAIKGEEVVEPKISALQVAIGDKVESNKNSNDPKKALLWGAIAVILAVFAYVVMM